MTFEEVLNQALAMLQRQGRVSYRALKRQFDLDDEYLEDLKVEIIEVHQLAIDQAGTMLVWTGDAGATPEPAPSSTQIATPRGRQDDQAAQVHPAPAASRPPDAERRQLTVMFCDLVDSTALSGQLDPEDLREVVRAYQATCTEVIQRFDGSIAQYLGDGLLVYFGYPQAHEDDAQRAVRAALGILDAMGTLNTRLEQDKNIRLAVRLGIHTGLVVVGEMGGGGRQEQLALGETPNVAARIQGLAAPDTVAISEATSRLIQGYFACHDLGPHILKGLAAPVQVYRVLGESGVQSRLEVASARGLTPLVGRESEVTMLLERWEQVKDGTGQVVVLSGEAGIGKSRLVQDLKDQVARESHTRVEYRCSPYYQHSALAPVIAHLERVLASDRDAVPPAKFQKLEDALARHPWPLPEVVPLLAALLSLPLPAPYLPLTLTPQLQKQKTLEALLAWLLAETEQQPVLFIVEDLHWVDPSTLEWLSLVVEQSPTARLCGLFTCRPEFTPPWSPRAHLTPLTLSRLPRPQVARLVHGVTGGKPLPAEVLAQIAAKTDGVPLFVEELTKTVLESGLLREKEDAYELTGSLPPLAIPATLHDSLMARLDRLAAVKAVAQLGATIGRQFSYELLQAVSPLDATALQQGLRQLVEAELVYQRGVPPQATYLFKHALIQDAAYQSLLKSTRQQYHQRIAQILAERFPDTAETQPELLAHHYTEAGLAEQALPYWQQAGQRATQRSAYVEAISHLSRGLALLTTLPDTPERAQHELSIQTTLGPVLLATRGQGSPEVEQAYARARELCQQVGETPQLFPVLFGLWVFYLMRAEYHTARGLAQQFFTLAQCTQDPALLLWACYLLGGALFWLGELAPAHARMEQGIVPLDAQQHRALTLLYGLDPKGSCLSWTAWTLWILGYPDQARARQHEALALAHELAHHFSLASAQAWAAIFYALCRDAHAAQAQAEAAITLSTELGIPARLAEGVLLRGWALVMQGQTEEGMAQLRQGIAAWRAAGSEIALPCWLALLAEAYGKAGQAGEGLTVLAEALALVHKTKERWWEAELYRLQGELLLMQAIPNEPQAEACFRQALDIARHQQAKSLELRAAMSLGRLWQRQGKTAQAHQLLAEVYAWFTEGFDTADLKEAKALLEQWA